jgi:mono/diheme cytochrome c family protein
MKFAVNQGMWQVGFLSLGLSMAAASAVPSLPPALARVPVDPAPGRVLPADSGPEVRLVVDVLSTVGGFLQGHDEKTGAPTAYRLLPYCSLVRFGVAGAADGEFPACERVRVRLIRGTENGPQYVREVTDEVTAQLRGGRVFTVRRVDRDNRKVEGEWSGGGDSQVETFDFGRGTVLNLRGNAYYTFTPPPGTQLRLNTGRDSQSAAARVRDAVDQPSLERFQVQQRLRLQARAWKHGVLVHPAGPTSLRVHPDFEPWAAGLREGGELRMADGGAPLKVTGAAGGRIEVVPGIVPLPRGWSRVRVADERVQYAAQVQPLLEGNCASCHRTGAAQSGFSISTMEALRAGSRRGPGIVPGKPDQSMLYLTVSGDRNPRMPPDRDFTAEQIALIRAWIEAGADGP